MKSSSILDTDTSDTNCEDEWINSSSINDNDSDILILMMNV